MKLCPQDPDREEPSVGSPTRSYLGFRGNETLGQLERTVQVRNGSGRDRCGRYWSGRSTVCLSDRSWGRIDLGRLVQPAWAVALAADPWGDSSAASPGARPYFPPEDGATRTSDSITYSSRADLPVAVALQLGRDRTGQSTELGGSARYARGAWYAGLGILLPTRRSTPLYRLGVPMESGTSTSMPKANRIRLTRSIGVSGFGSCLQPAREA